MAADDGRVSLRGLVERWREEAKRQPYTSANLKACINELAATLTTHEAKIEEYRAKLQGEAEMDERMLADAKDVSYFRLGRLDVMRSARRLEYFNELFPAPPRADETR